MKKFIKDPDAVLDYEFDWEDWLDGDTIVSFTAVVNETGGIDIDTSTNTATAVTVWVSGGVAGAVNSITCHIVTAGGREDDRTALFNINQR